MAQASGPHRELSALGIALVGCGGMGRRHLRGYAALARHHHELASKAMGGGRHALVEKPFGAAPTRSASTPCSRPHPVRAGPEGGSGTAAWSARSPRSVAICLAVLESALENRRVAVEDVLAGRIGRWQRSLDRPRAG